MFKKLAFLLVFVSMVFSVNSFAQVAKKESIKELLYLTGADKTGQMMLEKLIQSFKSMDSKVPHEFWTEVTKEFNSDLIIDSLVPVYQKHFTQKEIQDTIDFYNTPSGKKFVAKQPMVFQESFVIGQKVGREIGEKIMMKYREKYVNSSMK